MESIVSDETVQTAQADLKRHFTQTSESPFLRATPQLYCECAYHSSKSSVYCDQQTPLRAAKEFSFIDEHCGESSKGPRYNGVYNRSAHDCPVTIV